jgi:DNA-binding beta-propeller fold protein YncE
MKKRRILLALLGILAGWGMAGMAQANVTFETTDNPGSWFDCSSSTDSSLLGCVPGGVSGVPGVGSGKSLAIIKNGESITFQSTGQANTLHTVVSLIYPSGSNPAVMPFDADLEPGTGTTTVTPSHDGLHVFFCDIHPYMFAAVIVVPEATIGEALTNGLQLGANLNLNNVVADTLPLPTASDLVLRLVHTFFIITNPDNWQNFPAHGQPVDWKPAYPGVPVRHGDTGTTYIANLDEFLRGYFSEGGPTVANPKAPYLKHLAPPSMAHQTPGVGEVWVDTQFEKMSQKSKPGTATAVDATTFKVIRKVGLPSINMNSPHNMWTDKDQTVIYQTEWFDHFLTVFDRKNGKLVRRIDVGTAPAHVMTRTSNDYVHVSLNGANEVMEYKSLPDQNELSRTIAVGPTEDPLTHEPLAAMPHAHSMSSDGNWMVTPNPDTGNSSLINLNSLHIEQKDTGHFPIATGMMPDTSKYYVANFLDSTISVIGINTVTGAQTVLPSINLLGDIPHGVATYNPVSGPAPVGGLPIQIPVSPDGKYAIVANTLAAHILVIRTSDDYVVATLPCDPGCHGVQFGAKQGGGYYAYVSSKFSNRMIVVDPKNGSDASVVGSVLLTAMSATATDGTVSAYAGMGGQGVLPIPLVYNGWVQKLPKQWKNQLTPGQLNPFPIP